MFLIILIPQLTPKSIYTLTIPLDRILNFSIQHVRFYLSRSKTNLSSLEHRQSCVQPSNKITCENHKANAIPTAFAILYRPYE